MLNQSNDNKFFPDTRHLTPQFPKKGFFTLIRVEPLILTPGPMASEFFPSQSQSIPASKTTSFTT